MRYTPSSRRRDFWLSTIAALTATSGVFTLSSVLYEIKHLGHARLVIADAHFTVLAGISLVYLAMLCRRGKRNVWYILVAVFSVLLIRNLRHFLADVDIDEGYLFRSLANVLLPAVTLGLLILFRHLFVVKSEPASFSIALRRSVIILLVAFIYGLAGFQFLDDHDFHQEISLATSAHYTIDQFGLTTQSHVTAHSKRALFFIDSLAVISLASTAYVAISLFAPIKFRLRIAPEDHLTAKGLIKRYSSTSEDFFKLWPLDKHYYFNKSRTSFLAYRVVSGVALVVGDPVGPAKQLARLIRDFDDFCHLNDWEAAFIHCETKLLSTYKKYGYDIQKIGEEAIIDLNDFLQETARAKYFRQIKNRFKRLGYSCELLSPPHDSELLSRLRKISNDWLSQPGREERTFMMGYFNTKYLQACPVLVARDPDGQIRGFLNQLPGPSPEANFDFLRHTKDAPTNLNDFILMEFIEMLAGQGRATLNMGLAPLSGLGGGNTIVNNLLSLTYTAGNRFYSFQGLARFKSKYKPDWQDRYIVYRGGTIGFTKAMNGLVRAMRR